MKSKTLSLLAAIAYLLMLVVNILSVTLPINSVTPGEVSASFPNLFAPAGFTFSIWGLIYLLLLLFVLYQLGLFKTVEMQDGLLQKIRPCFIISSLLNAAWIFAWHYKNISLSLVLIIGILICLIKIANEIQKAPLSGKEKFFVSIPFSIDYGCNVCKCYSLACEHRLERVWHFGPGLDHSRNLRRNHHCFADYAEIQKYSIWSYCYLGIYRHFGKAYFRKRLCGCIP